MTDLTNNPAAKGDTRFTVGLLYDVFAVLKAHGYTAPNNNPSATGKAMLAVGDLVKAFEGRS